ncbi:MAG TPA: hypothetical protein VJB63_04600 [Patescibacteria group bacterium]|nr:hypothetical protein [Patescibacteria group bacterium]
MKKHTSLLEKLFDKNYQLIDRIDEIFELDLALWEYEVLSKKELVDRSAYSVDLSPFCELMGRVKPF